MGREPSSLAPALSALDKGRSIVPGLSCRGLGRSRTPVWHSPQAPEGKEGRCSKDEPREPALPLAAVHWARPGQQLQLSLPTVALLIPEERKPWGHLDQASAGRMLPFLCSSGSQSHGINSSEAGSPLGGLGSLPYGHVAPDTLFFVRAAWLGGLRTSADKGASSAPRTSWKLMKERLSSHLCPQRAQLTWSLGAPKK